MSAPSPGDFSCSDLVKIQALARQHFTPDFEGPDVTPDSIAAQAVADNQTANFTVLQNPEKDREVEVSWVQSCDNEVVDCGDQCDLTAPEAGSQCKTYALTQCKEIGFNIDRYRFRTNIHDLPSVYAKLLAEKLKAMDEWVAGHVVSQLVAFAGVNALTVPSTYVYDAGTAATYIPAAAWNPSLFGYFFAAKAMNKFPNMYLLSGLNLFQADWLAMMNQANADGKGAAAMMGSLKKYFDIFNVESGAAGSTFLINPNAVAIVSKVYYPAVPQYIAGQVGQWRSSISSPTIKGVSYDLYQGVVCTDNKIIDQWMLRAKIEVFQNPFGCDEGLTGVLRFVCGDVPV